MKVAVGISGGVDSVVAALLLKERGHEVVGVTMALGRVGEERALAEAREAAAALGIPLSVFDFAADWRALVLGYVRSAALAGTTPNPCVRCNETVKFSLLPRAAFALGCERFATGHYARLELGPDGRMHLLRGVERAKDQSYFLYRVPAEVLARTLLPLGGLAKAEVRELARRAGLAAADRGESQDFCGGDLPAIVGEPPREGDVVTADGRVLGRHRGFWRHTVGQRRGLGVGGGTPYYVIRLDAARNEVVVGPREACAVREFALADYVSRVPAPLARFAEEPLRVKVRSAGDPRGPVACDGRRIECGEGIVGVAPGQSAVLYRGDEVIGGGVISA